MIPLSRTHFSGVRSAQEHNAADALLSSDLGAGLFGGLADAGLLASSIESGGIFSTLPIDPSQQSVSSNVARAIRRRRAQLETNVAASNARQASITVGQGASISLIYNELKARAGQTVRVTAMRDGRVIRDIYYTLPESDRFNREFKGSMVYSWVAEGNSTSGEPVYRQGDIITFASSSVVEGGETVFQTFRRSADNQCLLRPIYDDMVRRSDGTTPTHRNWRSRALKMKAEMTNHPNGVSDTELANIAEKHRIKIEIVAPLQDKDDEKHIFACSTQKPVASYKFINCSINHVERVAQTGNVTEVTREALQIKYDELSRERGNIFRPPPFFAFQKDKMGITQIATASGSFVCKSKFMDIVQNFEQSTGLANVKICHITQHDLSRYVERGLLWNCATYVVDGSEGTPRDLQIIDLTSSYATYKTCSAYAGFPAKLTDHRPTDRVHGPGLYTIVDLDFSTCSDKFAEVVQLAGSPYRDNNVYPSPELAYLASNGVRFRVVEGAWSDATQNTLDFEFTGKKEDDTGMFSKFDTGERFYSVWAGGCAHRSDSSSFYMHGSERFFSAIKARLGDRVIRHFSDGIGSISYPRKRAYYLPQIPAFINAYERIRMFEQLSKMDLSKVHALQKDGIAFEDHEFEMDACFRRKGDAFHNANPCENYVYGVDESDYHELPPPPREIVDSPITLAVGGGGCGKTTHFLKDDGLVTPIFISPSWKLARSKQAEHGIACDVLANLISGDPEKVRSILTRHSVLIVDEISMVPLSVLESIVKTFRTHKIILCGDIGLNCVYQLPPVNCSPEDYPTILRFQESAVLGRAHVHTFSTNHRCKCPKLLRLLAELRAFIDGSHPCADEYDNDADRMRRILHYFTKKFEEEDRILTRQQTVEMYKIEDMILVSLRCLRDEYNTAVTEKNAASDAPVLRKWHVLANGRNFQNGQLVISETAPGVRCEESNAHTVHLCQGETCTEELFVDTRKLFEPQHLYTAISRGRLLSKIWLVSEPSDAEEDRTNPAYKHTKIYIIVTKEGKLCYIGHTVKELKQRLRGHLLDSKCMSRIVLGFGDAEIRLLEEYPCATRRDAVERERYWISRTPNCVNKNDTPRDAVSGEAVPTPAKACENIERVKRARHM